MVNMDRIEGESSENLTFQYSLNFPIHSPDKNWYPKVQDTRTQTKQYCLCCTLQEECKEQFIRYTVFKIQYLKKSKYYLYTKCIWKYFQNLFF